MPTDSTPATPIDVAAIREAVETAIADEVPLSTATTIIALCDRLEAAELLRVEDATRVLNLSAEVTALREALEAKAAEIGRMRGLMMPATHHWDGTPKDAPKGNEDAALATLSSGTPDTESVCPSKRFGGGDLSCQRETGHEGKHGSTTPWGGWVTWDDTESVSGDPDTREHCTCSVISGPPDDSCPEHGIDAVSAFDFQDADSRAALYVSPRELDDE